ncbi:MAG: 16S rRNA (uracil(1498)-N(3))-methyltransferase [Thermodesulfovibrionales bacterium]|nr:16S rRNA (uracil(1498)-N(3))-methyltransferase [Thermodesulfovibrionales bacterium]
MRILVPCEEIKKIKAVRLSYDKSHYLSSVLRCRKGDSLEVFDGHGKAYKAEISAISKENVFIDIIEELTSDTESTVNLILCQGILKGEKMDLVIQKTVELGVNDIAPVITERCLVRETRKTNRWRKIAEEAAKQCGRTVIPVIHEPIEFSQFLKGQGSGVKGHKLTGFIFWEEGGVPLNEAFFKVYSSFCRQSPNLPIHLFIGPEGGFAQEEVKTAEEYGLIRTTLGRRILRAETAAISSVALVQFLFENRFCYNI